MFPLLSFPRFCLVVFGHLFKFGCFLLDINLYRLCLFDSVCIQLQPAYWNKRILAQIKAK